MRVLFLIEGWIAPGPRYRVLQYLDFLKARGVEYEVRAMHGTKLPIFHHWKVIGKIYKFIIRSLRVFSIRDVEKFDVVFQQRLTLPFSSLIEKRITRKNPHYIFDFDDALFQTADGKQGIRRRVFDRVVAMAATNIAGSKSLADLAGRNMVVIPTVVDTVRYKPRAYQERPKVVIGWTGTHSNYSNFGLILDVLDRILRKYKHVEFKMVGDISPSFHLPRMTFVSWSEHNEIEVLQEFDIGIMPLIDSSSNRGKCAFKLIQYMSLAIPQVASPVGANNDVVLDRTTGLLAESPTDWERALSELIKDPVKRRKIGAAARVRCVEKFSVSSQQDALLKVIEDVAKSSRGIKPTKDSVYD